VLAEYQARLAADPGNGANHYLYARLIQDPERSVPHYQEAIRLQPDLAWGRVGLAYSLLAMERHAEAAEHLERALRMPDRDPSLPVPYVLAAIGAGAADHAGDVLGSLAGKPDAEDGYLWQARWLVLLARGDHEAAAKLLQARGLGSGDRDPEVWRLRTQLLRLQGDAAGLRRALAEGRLRPELSGLAATLRQEQALAAGSWSEAATAFDGLKPEDISYGDRLFAAWALAMSGDREQAGRRLAELDAELSQNAQDPERSALLAMTRHLERRAGADAVLAAARRAGYAMLPQAYFVLAAAREAAGDAAGARALYEKSRRTALDFSAPYLAAAARAKEAG
jgi:hypothetical protein